MPKRQGDTPEPLRYESTHAYRPEIKCEVHGAGLPGRHRWKTETSDAPITDARIADTPIVDAPIAGPDQTSDESGEKEIAGKEAAIYRWLTDDARPLMQMIERASADGRIVQIGNRADLTRIMVATMREYHQHKQSRCNMNVTRDIVEAVPTRLMQRIYRRQDLVDGMHGADIEAAQADDACISNEVTIHVKVGRPETSERDAFWQTQTHVLIDQEDRPEEAAVEDAGAKEDGAPDSVCKVHIMLRMPIEAPRPSEMVKRPDGSMSRGEPPHYRQTRYIEVTEIAPYRGPADPNRPGDVQHYLTINADLPDSITDHIVGRRVADLIDLTSMPIGELRQLLIT